MTKKEEWGAKKVTNRISRHSAYRRTHTHTHKHDSDGEQDKEKGKELQVSSVHSNRCALIEKDWRTTRSSNFFCKVTHTFGSSIDPYANIIRTLRSFERRSKNRSLYEHKHTSIFWQDKERNLFQPHASTFPYLPERNRLPRIWLRPNFAFR